MPLNVVAEITSLVTPPAPAQAYGRDVGEVGMREKGSQNQDEEPERMSRLAVIGAGYVGARDECHPRPLGPRRLLRRHRA